MHHRSRSGQPRGKDLWSDPFYVRQLYVRGREVNWMKGGRRSSFVQLGCSGSKKRHFRRGNPSVSRRKGRVDKSRGGRKCRRVDTTIGEVLTMGADRRYGRGGQKLGSDGERRFVSSFEGFFFAPERDLAGHVPADTREIPLPQANFASAGAVIGLRQPDSL